MNKETFGRNRYCFIKLNKTESKRKYHRSIYNCFMTTNLRLAKNPDDTMLQKKWYEYRNMLNELEAKLTKNNPQTSY